MHILVTAGNTLVPIDRVRGITNIFTGRTGTAVAAHCLERGHAVLLLTSHPDLLSVRDMPAARWSVQAYRTFDELQQQMEAAVVQDGLDVVIHCAAVSDYQAAGVYSPAPGTSFSPATGHWQAARTPTLVDRSAGKVKSDEPELWLRLVRTPKLIDLVRCRWGFRGVLVKFKLEVGVDDARLLEIAERSRRQSDADLMVANTLEGMASWAYLGPRDGHYQRVGRPELAARLLDAVERLHQERSHG